MTPDFHIEIGSAPESSTTQEERKSFTEKIAMLEEAMYRSDVWCRCADVRYVK